MTPIRKTIAAALTAAGILFTAVNLNSTEALELSEADILATDFAKQEISVVVGKSEKDEDFIYRYSLPSLVINEAIEAQPEIPAIEAIEEVRDEFDRVTQAAVEAQEGTPAIEAEPESYEKIEKEFEITITSDEWNECRNGGKTEDECHAQFREKISKTITLQKASEKNRFIDLQTEIEKRESWQDFWPEFDPAEVEVSEK